MFGYHSNYLRIDVTTAEAQRVALDESTLREYVGGSGLGVKLLLEEGAAVNAGAEDGWTALMFASQNDHLEVVSGNVGDEVHGAGKPVSGGGAVELADGKNHLGRGFGPTRRRLDGRILRKGTFIAFVYQVSERVFAGVLEQFESERGSQVRRWKHRYRAR